jgi:predicted nucleic acid-binding protein
MRVLIDVNVFMDVLQAREGMRASLGVLSTLREQAQHQGFVAALTIPILYYLESRTHSDLEARAYVQKVLQGLTIVDLTAEVIQLAFEETRIPDFEDCVQYYSAKAASCQGIITRNNKDFRNIELDVYTPDEFLAAIK